VAGPLSFGVRWHNATPLHCAVDHAKLVVASVAVFVARGLAVAPVGVVIAAAVCRLTRRCSGPGHASGFRGAGAGRVWPVH
jgi:hypothetical protein